ncbi:hypothetical protein MPER_04204, partial [Moniliophthora perniciosa FA553]
MILHSSKVRYGNRSPRAPGGGIVLPELMGLRSDTGKLDPGYQIEYTSIQWGFKKTVPSTSNGQFKYLPGTGREWVPNGPSGIEDDVIYEQVRETLTATVQWGWKQKQEKETENESFPAEANSLVEPEQWLGRSNASTERSSDGTDIVDDRSATAKWGWKTKEGVQLPS